MTRQEIIDYCLTLPAAYEDYPFDNVVDENACTVMRHRQNKKGLALIMRYGGELYLNLKCEPLETDFLRGVYQSVLPGYHMNKTHWNHGYTTEAMRAILNFAATNLSIKRVAGGHAKGDLASPKVLEKLGFVYDRDDITPHVDGVRYFDSREYFLDL